MDNKNMNVKSVNGGHLGANPTPSPDTSVSASKITHKVQNQCEHLTVTYNILCDIYEIITGDPSTTRLIEEIYSIESGIRSNLNLAYELEDLANCIKNQLI